MFRYSSALLGCFGILISSSSSAVPFFSNPFDSYKPSLYMPYPEGSSLHNVPAGSYVRVGQDKGATITVVIKGKQIDQPELTVKVGDKVVWINRDKAPLILVTGHSKARTKALFQNHSTSATFNEPGVYEYYSHRDPAMKGRIIVEAENS